MVRIFTVLLFVFCTVHSADAQKTRAFEKGDRVAFVGNSITDGGHYHSYVWLYYMTRFPEKRIEILNAGIGGDAAEQIAQRFDDDVVARKPTSVYLTFGMNDSGYGEYLQAGADSFGQSRIRKSYASYRVIEDKLKSMKKARIVLMTSSPYDETTKGRGNYFPGKSRTMQEISAFQEKSARENKWDFIDLNSAMTAINLRGQQEDSTFTLCGNDRIHPDNDGHLVMAYFILKSQGLAGKEVADMHVDVSNRSIRKATNCQLDKLTVTTDTVQVFYLAKSLPFPVDTIGRGWGGGKKSADALKVIPFTEEMNKEMLTVTGLPDGSHTLFIDGVKIGSWPAAAYQTGINLALLTNTPQYQQALNIMAINEKRWEIERRFRTYVGMQNGFFRQYNLMYQDDKNALDTLKKYAHTNPFMSVDFYQTARFKKIRENWKTEMDNLTDIIYTVNKPVTHKIEIVRTGSR